MNRSEDGHPTAPGGYILMTRGMYELLADDGEVAAVLGHEIGHVVQRDHYTVIHKQEVAQAGTELLASQVNVGGGLAGQFAKDYVTRDIFESLMKDEESHIDFLETQIDLVKKIGVELYSQKHIGELDHD